MPAAWAAMAALACAGASSPPDAPGSTAPTRFVREVTGIPVADSAGTPYTHPFLGGLNLPRPQLVDIDGDGDLDLFAQEYSDHLMFFERTGPDPQDYTWRTAAWQDLSIGEWYRFVDLDRDGDVDLLAETPFSYIRLYRNDGSPTDPRFTLATDTLRDVTGAPIFSDRQNIPQVTDIDCNGRLDLFIGRVTGTILRYEEAGTGPTGLPRFALLTERFQDIEIVAQLSGSRHGANTMSFVDIDDDGDQDLFWGDFFEPGLLMIENTGSCAAPSLRGDPRPYPLDDPIATSGYNASAFGDLDRDGDLDLLVGVLGGAFNPNRTTIDNFLYLERRGPNAWRVRTHRFLTQIDVGSESIPVLLDDDGDGDLDLLLSNKIDQTDLTAGRVYRFENIGSPTAPVYRWTGPLPAFAGAYHYDLAPGDLDGDGDLDLIVGNWRNTLAFYRNDGTHPAHYTLVDSALVRLTRGSNATPTLVDIDADGDLDLFAGEGSGTLNFWRNDGTGRSPAFTLVSDTYQAIDIGRRSNPAFADLDGDGDQDLIVGTESDGLVVFRNVGTATAPDFVPSPTWRIDVPPFAAPALGDIDADGDLDLMLGGIGGGVTFFRNVAR